jgi:hypothetical protein
MNRPIGRPEGEGVVSGARLQALSRAGDRPDAAGVFCCLLLVGLCVGAIVAVVLTVRERAAGQPSGRQDAITAPHWDWHLRP